MSNLSLEQMLASKKKLEEDNKNPVDDLHPRASAKAAVEHVFNTLKKRDAERAPKPAQMPQVPATIPQQWSDAPAADMGPPAPAPRTNQQQSLLYAGQDAQANREDAQKDARGNRLIQQAQNARLRAEDQPVQHDEWGNMAAATAIPAAVGLGVEGLGAVGAGTAAKAGADAVESGINSVGRSGMQATAKLAQKHWESLPDVAKAALGPLVGPEAWSNFWEHQMGNPEKAAEVLAQHPFAGRLSKAVEALKGYGKEFPWDLTKEELAGTEKSAKVGKEAWIKKYGSWTADSEKRRAILKAENELFQAHPVGSDGITAPLGGKHQAVKDLIDSHSKVMDKALELLKDEPK
jgi:hypothetical protein